MDDLMVEILEELKIELDVTEEKDIEQLTVKLKNAIRDIKVARGYLSSHTEDFINKDIQNYIGNIKDLAMYYYTQIGAEGHLSLDENNTNRVWKSRSECFSGICSFVE